MASPMANIVWCGSGISRSNSTGISSAAVFGRAATGLDQHSSQRCAWCACNCSTRACRPRKGAAVRGQHQRVLGQRQELIDRVEEQPQRIGPGRAGHHRNVGRDARQQHVAGNQDAELGAIQAHVLRGVAMADEGAPFMRADAQALVGEQAPIGGGDFRHAALVAIAALDQAVDARLLKSMRAEEFNHGADRVAGDLLHHHLRREVFALGDPQPGAGLLFQPGRQAQVVGGGSG
jgi:hypothetical protein